MHRMALCLNFDIRKENVLRGSLAPVASQVP